MMFSNNIGTNKASACQHIFGMMVRASKDAIQNYHSDLWHDAQALRKKDEEKSLIDRQIEDEESVFWSVGEFGTHMAIYSNPDDRAWIKIASYKRYAHYRVWFSITERGMITAQLIPVPNAEPKQLTSGE